MIMRFGTWKKDPLSLDSNSFFQPWLTLSKTTTVRFSPTLARLWQVSFSNATNKEPKKLPTPVSSLASLLCWTAMKWLSSSPLYIPSMK
jgi:hypothetical protein